MCKILLQGTINNTVENLVERVAMSLKTGKLPPFSKVFTRTYIKTHIMENHMVDLHVFDYMQKESCENDIYKYRYVQSNMDVHGSIILGYKYHNYFITESKVMKLSLKGS